MPLSLHPTAEACGKVIMLGEHAVVYGVPALAAGIPSGVTLAAAPRPSPTDPLRLSIPAWDLDLTIDARSEHPVALACLAVLGFCDGPLSGWTITGRSELLPGAGLGSSAALTVALARLALGPDADAATVVEASLCGERVFHGEPSGVDSEVAARGGVLRYVRGQTPESVAAPPLSLCVIPSGIERRTAEQVAKVRARHDRHPTVVRPILEAVTQAVNTAIDAIKSNDIETLGEMMDVDHGLLVALGVSSPRLDELCSIARSAGALGAKLTGAGGGGCIVCVPPTDRTAFTSILAGHGLHPLLIEVTA